MAHDRELEPMQRLLNLVARLCAPDGCPWDREQEIEDLRAYLLEEAHEAADAIDRGNRSDLAEELGDLLFQIAFIGHLAKEEGSFDLDEVAARAEAKMVARHPHVFGDANLDDAQAVRQAWERRKVDQTTDGHLDGVPSSLPALLAAFRLGQKAAGIGFDWPDSAAVTRKLDEELSELHEALAHQSERKRNDEVVEELGDVLFTLANLARHLGFDPEAALAASNSKFRHRFRQIERLLAEQDLKLTDVSAEELGKLWDSAKREGAESESADPQTESPTS